MRDRSINISRPVLNMTYKSKKTNAEIISAITRKAIFSVEGVSALVNGPIPFNLRIHELEKGIWVMFDNHKIDFYIYINVLYGSKIPQIAFSVQESIKKSIDQLTNLKVNKVNIHIEGIDYK